MRHYARELKSDVSDLFCLTFWVRRCIFIFVKAVIRNIRLCRAVEMSAGLVPAFFIHLLSYSNYVFGHNRYFMLLLFLLLLLILILLLLLPMLMPMR